MRRTELAALGVQLPVLPTIALGGLPGPPTWAPILERLGLDVVASGAEPDTAATWAAARAAVPHRPVKGVPGDAAELVDAGCRLLETGASAPAGAYALRPGDAMVAPIRGDDQRVEDLDEVARAILAAARAGTPSGLWVVATRGLDRLAPPTVRAKLAVLVEAATQARLAIAKVQFDL